MEDADNVLQPTKKRAAERELSRDNTGLEDDGDHTEEETGTFKKASKEVLASRKILKVKRQQPSSAVSSNPFAGISLVPPKQSCGNREDVIHQSITDDEAKSGETAVPNTLDDNAEGNQQLRNDADQSELEVSVQEETKPEDVPNTLGDNAEGNQQLRNEADQSELAVSVQEETKPEGEKKAPSEEPDKEANEEANNHTNTGASAAGASLNLFQQLSGSRNAFTGVAGTGFSSSSFSFGSFAKDGSTPSFGLNNHTPIFPSSVADNSKYGSSSIQLFGAAAAPEAAKGEGSGFPSFKEVPIETGEENEEAVFTADATLFEYLDRGWRERGKGELKLNTSSVGSKRARMVMRTKGNYRLILNANLFPDMKLESMDKRGITFACMNTAGEGNRGLSTHALKFKDASIVDEFRRYVILHKGEKTADLKTPENSLKECDS